MGKSKKKQPNSSAVAAATTSQEKKDREYALKVQSEVNKEEEVKEQEDTFVDDGWESTGAKGRAQKRQQKKMQKELEEERMKEIARQNKLAEEKARKQEQERLEAEKKKAEEKKRKEEEKKKRMEEKKRQEEEMKRRQEEQKEIEKGDHEMALELQKKMDEEEERRKEEALAADEAAGWVVAGSGGKKRARQKKAAEHKKEVEQEKSEHKKAIMEQQQQQQQKKMTEPQKMSKTARRKAAKKAKEAEAAAAAENEKLEENTENTENTDNTENTEEGKKKEKSFSSWAEAVKTCGKRVTYKGVGSIEYKPSKDEIERSNAPFSLDYFLQPCGFTNRGNKCYFNAVMQIFLANSAFREMIGRVRDLKRKVMDPRNFAMIPLLLEFIDLIQGFPTYKVSAFENNNYLPVISNVASDLKDIQGVVLPEFLRGVCGNPALVPAIENEQQDAQELFSFMLDKIHEELLVLEEATKCVEDEDDKSDDKKDGDDDDDEGEWMIKTKGGKDAVIRTQEKSFKNTMIDDIFAGKIKSYLDNKDTNKTSVNEQPFYTLQLDINADKVYSVEDALKLYQEPELIEGDMKMLKTNKIEDPPKVLALHFKRFVFINKSFPIKCSKPVLFKETLGLSGKGYVLSGVIRHHGTTAIKGHYTCDVRCLDKFWLRCNDTSLEWADSVDEILKDNMNTYMLFYVRKDKD